MFKQVLLLIGVLVSCLCYTSCSYKSLKFQDAFVGKYESLFSTLEIKTDSTFHYSFYDMGMKHTGETVGRVRFEGKRSFLYSNVDSIIKEEQSVDIGYQIKVVDLSGQTLFGIKCIAFQNENMIGGAITEFDGVCMLDVSNIDKILIEQIGYRSITIDLKEYQSNAFTVVVDEPYLYMVFQGQELKVKRKHIEIIEDENSYKFRRVN